MGKNPVPGYRCSTLARFHPNRFTTLDCLDCRTILDSSAGRFTVPMFYPRPLTKWRTSGVRILVSHQKLIRTIPVCFFLWFVVAVFYRTQGWMCWQTGFIVFSGMLFGLEKEFEMSIEY